MEMANVWRQFDTLSPAAKRQVAELIAFLSARGRRRSASETLAARPLTEEGFVGIWNDREELADSTEWVRRLRRDDPSA